MLIWFWSSMNLSTRPRTLSVASRIPLGISTISTCSVALDSATDSFGSIILLTPSLLASSIFLLASSIFLIPIWSRMKSISCCE